MRKSAQILVASLLLAVFGIFTVGLPVVRYLCPMMNEDALACPYSPQSRSAGVTLSNQIPSCCASYIVAERNRTPFTSLQGYSSLPLQALSYATPDDVIGFNGHSVTAIARTPDTSPPLPGEPLYLLNNSLLI